MAYIPDQPQNIYSIVFCSTQSVELQVQWQEDQVVHHQGRWGEQRDTADVDKAQGVSRKDLVNDYL